MDAHCLINSSSNQNGRASTYEMTRPLKIVRGEGRSVGKNINLTYVSIWIPVIVFQLSAKCSLVYGAKLEQVMDKASPLAHYPASLAMRRRIA